MSETTNSPSPTQTNELLEDCVTAVPGENGNVPITACNSYYNFDPKFEPAVAMAVLFGLVTACQIVQAIMHRKGYCWVIIMGGLWETISFAVHAVGARDQQNIGYSTSHQLLFLLAPLWINAFVYMTFARMVYFFLPEQRIARIRASSLARYFVLADIVSFIVQGIGGIMASPTASETIIKTGINIYMSGMGVQEFFILFFTVLMVRFQLRATELEQAEGITRPRPWRGLTYTLYGVLTAITVRIIFRICEYARGVQPSNPIPFNEEYAYALDAFPMLLALLILCVFHPGRILVGAESEFPRVSRKEKKAIKKEKKDKKKAEKEEKKARKQRRKLGIEDDPSDKSTGNSEVWESDGHEQGYHMDTRYNP